MDDSSPNGSPPPEPLWSTLPTAAHLDQLPDGTNWELKDFTMKETLGTGTFGRVRLCQHKTDGGYYAMKDEKRLYIVLEYVCGGELFSHLRKAGKFPNDVAKFYAAEIILAFEYLHSLDILYRDLKPENLLLDTAGHVRITDFGFAKKVPERTFTLCGTPEYLAPETIQSKGQSKGIDWWALGILTYEMLVGYPPFFDESPFRIYEKILEGKIQFPKWVDSRAKDIIKGLLAVDHTKRLGSLKRGVVDVKTHKWLYGVDWDQLLARKIPAPIPVKVSNPGDSRYFDRYPESTEETITVVLEEAQQQLFETFGPYTVPVGATAGDVA